MEKIKYYNISNVGETVSINGWVSKVRNLVGLVFIDLRNRAGIIQVVVRPESKYYDLANELKSEYVIHVTGKIVERVSHRFGKTNTFYGCDKFPKCRTIFSKKPTGEKCPECGEMLVEGTHKIECSNKMCEFEKEK
jgi:hypothetical protein